MKQYKIDAFKGYEKFMKKIGRDKGYTCSLSWTDRQHLELRLSKPSFVKNGGTHGERSTYMFDPTLDCNVYRFDENGKEANMYKETYRTLVGLHGDLVRLEKAFEEDEK